MARYKFQERHSLLLPIVLREQLVPGSFAFALDYLVDHELDLSAMDAKFKNDVVGTSAYDPRVTLKIVLLRSRCLKKQSSQRARQVTRFEARVPDPSNPSERMKRAIDTERGRRLCSQRIGTIEPVFGNLGHNQRLARLNLRGHEKVNAQWHLYCMVHNTEKLANSGWAR